LARLRTSFNAAEDRLRAIAPGANPNPSPLADSDRSLRVLGLADDTGLTEPGNDYYQAEFVLHDEDAAAKALAAALKAQPTVNAFCEKLWGKGEIPVAGAVNLLKQIHHDTNDTSPKRWLEVMNRARLIVYNRASPRMRVLYNPGELAAPEEEAERERVKGHLLSPDTPYGNLLALRELIRAARGAIRWWEQHLPPKVLEVLYKEVDGANVSEIRLLSGPATVTADAKEDFKRFRKDMATRRIAVEWRVVPKKEARNIHGRFFISDDLSRNIPPLNTILMGTTDEILPSDVGADDFDKWWEQGEDIAAFTPED
jgi:hypothetical protein